MQAFGEMLPGFVADLGLRMQTLGHRVACADVVKAADEGSMQRALAGFVKGDFVQRGAFLKTGIPGAALAIVEAIATCAAVGECRGDERSTPFVIADRSLHRFRAEALACETFQAREHFHFVLVVDEGL
eukprot:gene2598-2638_t